MSDLISRSALIEKMNDYISHTDERNSEHYVCKRIKKIIEDAPTVEAKPVVHGEWIKIKDWDENDNVLFECNNCHHADIHAKSVKVPYCWYCGAKMSYSDMRKKVE